MEESTTSEGEPAVGIIWTKGHPIFHSAGEHPVWLTGAQSGEIIN